MSYTETGICNIALAKLGHTRISAIGEASKAGQLCAMLYEPNRDAVLRDHAWNFATRRIMLALDPATPPFRWAFAYSYPTDCILARELSDRDEEFEVASDTEKRRRLIYADMEAAGLVYTARITDPSMFDPMFVEALAAKLAAELARPLVNSGRVHQEMQTMYVNILDRAKARDANEGQTEPDDVNPWVRARL